MEATQTMNAIRGHHRGGSETLVYEPVARPLPDSGEVLVEVHAAGITPTELYAGPNLERTSRARAALPIIPSDEISGVVAKSWNRRLEHSGRRRGSTGPTDFFPQWRGGGVRDCQESPNCRPSRGAWTTFTRLQFHRPRLRAWQAFRTHAFRRAGLACPD